MRYWPLMKQTWTHHQQIFSLDKHQEIMQNILLEVKYSYRITNSTRWNILLLRSKFISLGATSSHSGWLSSDEDTNPNEHSGDDDDDGMIQLTPEPLCEELEQLIREVYGQKKMWCK